MATKNTTYQITSSIAYEAIQVKKPNPAVSSRNSIEWFVQLHEEGERGEKLKILRNNACSVLNLHRTTPLSRVYAAALAHLKIKGGR